LVEGCPIVTGEHTQQGHRDALRPSALLLAGEGFPGIGSAEEVLAAIDRGLRASGLSRSDLCPLEAPQDGGRADAALLAGVDFDARLHVARAIVIAADELDPGRLPGSMSFELATRARQGGVPAFAVTAHDGLDRFDARILDLQAVIEARTLRGLAAAGRRLARLL
jgi:hypothetical protein